MLLLLYQSGSHSLVFPQIGLPSLSCSPPKHANSFFGWRLCPPVMCILSGLCLMLQTRWPLGSGPRSDPRVPQISSRVSAVSPEGNTVGWCWTHHTPVPAPAPSPVAGVRSLPRIARSFQSEVITWERVHNCECHSSQDKVTPKRLCFQHQKNLQDSHTTQTTLHPSPMTQHTLTALVHSDQFIHDYLPKPLFPHYFLLRVWNYINVCGSYQRIWQHHRRREINPLLISKFLGGGNLLD